MPTPLEVVRPHDMRCRHCVEYDDSGNELETSGHYVCQATGCDELADFTWPRSTPDGTESVLSCAEHAIPPERRDRPHADDCTAPDPGCVCELA